VNRWGWLLLWGCLLGWPAWAQQVTWAQPQWCVLPEQAASSASPPCTPWQSLTLPLAHRPLRPQSETIWIRLPFVLKDLPHDPMGMYVPYLHHGARVLLNGQLVAHLPGATGEREVRWEHPVLWQVPPSFLREGANELQLEIRPGRDLHVVRMARVALGDWMSLNRQRDVREFLMQGLPQLTVLMCGFIAVFLAMIWLMQPQEKLYALLACALALWGLRTSTFLVESLPHDQWLLWRSTYHWATGGFVVMLSLFASGFVGRSTRRWRKLALAWWFVGPLGLLAAGVTWEPFVSLYWTAGLALIGLLGLTELFRALRHERSIAAWLMTSAAAVAFVAGVHDLLMANVPQALAWLGPEWIANRLFLLHHAANWMLLCLAAVMTKRFVDTLKAMSRMNQDLEETVRARERMLDLAFKEKAQLMVAHATEEERQRIVVDMHDGLGSRLFTTLTRVERGVASTDETSLALRACIDDMRLMIDALSPGPPDLSAAFASFRHRWDENLQALQLNPRWEVSDEVLAWQPGAHQVMQILQVLQEALTNVVKHAQASQVGIAAWRTPLGEVVFEVLDDGRGILGERQARGRGSINMSRRAERLGGRLRVDSTPQGTRVTLTLPAATGVQAALATG
jgi:signal transduction histidine kinase